MLTVNAVFIILIALSAAISSVLILYAWSRRSRSPYALYFMVFMVVVTIWTVSSTLSFLSTQPEAAYFWSVQMRYIGVVLLPVTMLAFAMVYANGGAWLGPVRLGLLLIIPFLTIAIIWSPYSALFLYGFQFEQVGSFMMRLTNQNGPWFWVHSGYSYALTLLAFGILMVNAVRAAYPRRGQAVLLVTGAMVPSVTNVLTVTGVIDPIPPDLTAVSFTVTAVLWAVALFQYRLLDISPVARHQVVEGMDDAVIVLDSNNHIVDINPQARALIPNWKASMLGASIGQVFPAQKDLLAQLNRAEQTHFEFETELEGARRVFDIRYNALLDQSGRAIGRLIVLRDITARKQTEEERERLIGELNAYAHTVAHDLKNPLGVVISAGNFLLDFKAHIDEAKETDYLHRIVRTSAKMINIVDELLLLASVREMRDVELTPLDMTTVVADSLRRVSHDVDASQAKVDAPAEWPQVVGYAPWVEEVWTNYMSNAIKYGGKPPILTLGADDTANGQVRFWVRDNGSGLTPEECAKLFADFERLGALDVDGHGLGLSIVRRIITRLGGEVGVDSTVGKGSTFYFTLPTAPTAQPSSVASKKGV